MKNATPLTLEQAIENAIESLTQDRSASRSVDVIYDHVKDFLAQRFGASMLASDDATSRKLERLFKLITERKKSDETREPREISES